MRIIGIRLSWRGRVGAPSVSVLLLLLVSVFLGAPRIRRGGGGRLLLDVCLGEDPLLAGAFIDAQPPIGVHLLVDGEAVALLEAAVAGVLGGVCVQAAAVGDDGLPDGGWLLTAGQGRRRGAVAGGLGVGGGCVMGGGWRRRWGGEGVGGALSRGGREGSLGREQLLNCVEGVFGEDAFLEERFKFLAPG